MYLCDIGLWIILKYPGIIRRMAFDQLIYTSVRRKSNKERDKKSIRNNKFYPCKAKKKEYNRESKGKEMGSNFNNNLKGEKRMEVKQVVNRNTIEVIESISTEDLKIELNLLMEDMEVFSNENFRSILEVLHTRLTADEYEKLLEGL